MNESVYSLVFGTFVKPEHMDTKAKNFEKSEWADAFLQAFFVFCIQSLIIFLIIYYMLSEDFEVLKANTYLIIIPRFISSYMMHLDVEGKIRNGINLMKYTVTNPSHFKFSEDNKYRGLILPFFLGFAQASVSIVVEILVIIFLTSEETLIKTIVHYATLSGFIKFEDNFSKAMIEHKLLTLKDAVLTMNKKDDDRDRKENGDDNSWLLKFLKGAYKTFRLHYLCISYYFLPYL